MNALGNGPGRSPMLSGSDRFMIPVPKRHFMPSELQPCLPWLGAYQLYQPTEPVVGQVTPPTCPSSLPASSGASRILFLA